MANNTGIKYGGKQKGTPNKATARLRELLEGNRNSSIKSLRRTLRTNFKAP